LITLLKRICHLIWIHYIGEAVTFSLTERRPIGRVGIMEG